LDSWDTLALFSIAILKWSFGDASVRTTRISSESHMSVNRLFFLRLGILSFLISGISFAEPRKLANKPSMPAPKTSPTGHDAILDTALIRKIYMDGEFEDAIEILEKGLSEKRPFSHEDSVFIFKHLGVMNAARYETRELGKRYMFQLLMIEPTAKIMDMYASDMIYMIFKNIQDEFQTQRARYAHAKGLVDGNQQAEPNPKSQPPEDKPKPESSGVNHTLLWIGATGAVAAVGVAAYLVLSPGGTKTTQNQHSVDEF
jgi:hypothetical protein